MITIRLNKQKYKIPIADELTFKQFDAIKSKLKEQLKTKESSTMLSIQAYLSSVTDVDFHIIPSLKIPNLNKLIFLIGAIDPNPSNELPENFYFRDKLINFKEITAETSGYELFMLDWLQKNKETSKYKTYEYSAALALSGATDNDKINEVLKEISQLNYRDILNIGAFFLASSRLGRSSKIIRGMRSLTNTLTNTRKRVINWALNV